MTSTAADPRLARPSWRGRTNVDAFTIAAIEHAEQIVRDITPANAHQFVVTQGSYQGTEGDPDSGSTHRLGGAVDLRYCGHPLCLWALRKAGMFIWHRRPDQGDWPDHYHGAPIGHPFMDERLKAQEADYLGGGNGLGSRDDGPRLSPIPRPVWPWPEEDDMVDPAVKDQLDRIEKQGKVLLERTEGMRVSNRKILQALTELEEAVADDATKDQVKTLVARARDKIVAALPTPPGEPV